MKILRYCKLGICIFIVIVQNLRATAQPVSADSLLAKALATDELLPTLIDSAFSYSASLKRLEHSEALANTTYQISKKAIYSAFNIQSSYMYGTNYSAVNNQSPLTPGSNLTTAQTGFYNVGIGMQLPLSYIINRKNILKAGQSQINMVSAEKENFELLVKQEVIRLYQDFKLSQKMLSISSKNRQAAQINKSMAEKDFVNGQLTVDRLSVVLESSNRSIVDFETFLNKFQTAYLQLEAFTGVDLSVLIKQVK